MSAVAAQGPSWLAAARHGAADGWARVGGRFGWMTSALALLVVASAARLERNLDLLRATERTLTGVVLGVLVPLLAWAVVFRCLGSEPLAQRAGAVGRWGGSRGAWVVGVMASATLGFASLGAVLGAVGVLAAGSPVAGGVAADALVSAWVSALAAAATVLVLFGARSLHRFAAHAWLVLDWTVGSGVGAGAVAFCRAHARSLAGGAGPLELAQGTSFALLVGFGLVGALVTWLRTPD